MRPRCDCTLRRPTLAMSGSRCRAQGDLARQEPDDSQRSESCFHARSPAFRPVINVSREQEVAGTKNEPSNSLWVVDVRVGWRLDQQSSAPLHALTRKTKRVGQAVVPGHSQPADVIVGDRGTQLPVNNLIGGDSPTSPRSGPTATRPRLRGRGRGSRPPAAYRWSPSRTSIPPARPLAWIPMQKKKTNI